MPRLKEVYDAECEEEMLTAPWRKALSPSPVGHRGRLGIYESEHKYPGQRFLSFIYKNGRLQTSPGEVCVDLEAGRVSILTRQNNYYVFRVLDGPKKRDLLEYL